MHDGANRSYHPLPAYPPLALQPMQRRVEQAGLDLQHLSGLGTQSLNNPVSVLSATLQSLEDEDIECVLEQFSAIFVRAGRRGHRM